MYDAKTVRRRRAVLGLLVVCSLILITASFGDNGGPLRSIQNGVVEVISPIQEGASRSLKPVRDLFGWVGDTIDAKGENKDLRKERDRYRAEAAAAKNALQENARLRGLLALDTRAELDRYKPVTARVIARSSLVLSTTINIDKGSSSGIRVDQPVLAGAGLVGKVTQVGRGYAIVTLITDHRIGVTAEVAETGVNGTVESAVGNPRDLILKYTRRSDRVDPKQMILTAGTRTSDPKYRSLFPPGIPIGEVTRIDEPGTDSQKVHLRPYVDVGRIDFVQVLTEAANGNRPVS
ncbi:rod shape-determining protein MreC [Paraconexibacter sp.]|uniref:rod shape-determining protein MreC n=1 Tax=Paraconexibacter sp. TaxID=2949640 RepID=UPI0035684DC9